MASTSILLSVLCLLLALSPQIHAREFFSKVSSANTNNNVNNAEETTTLNEQQPATFVPENQKTELPKKEEQQYVTKQQQDPTFLPQTQTQSGYGLYGHESGQYAPETTAAATTTPNKVTYEPYVTPIRSGTFENYPNSNTNNNNNYYYNNNNAYEREQQQNLGGARFTDSGSYRTPATFAESRGYRTTATNDNGNGYNSNVERQGMSDTRFLDNGKYFYDAQNQNNYYQNQYQQNPRGNQYSYSTRGASYYGNNANSYDPMNDQRYGNQEEFDEEFEP